VPTVLSNLHYCHSSHNLYMGLFLSTCNYTIVTTYSIHRDGMDNLECYYLQKQHNYSHQVENNFYLEIDIAFIFIRGYYNIIPKGIKVLDDCITLIMGMNTVYSR